MATDMSGVGCRRVGRSVRQCMASLLAVAALSTMGGAQAQSQTASAGLRVLPVQGAVSMISGPRGNVAVHVGDEGVVVVDTMTAADADALLATVRSISPRPVRYIINTSADDDRTGGNAIVSKGGEQFSQNATFNAPAQYATRIIAHENVVKQLVMPAEGGAPPDVALPSDTYFVKRKELAMSHEPIQIVHLPAAHTDGDSAVMFRRSDVIVTGAVYTPDRYPVIVSTRGGSVNGVIDGLNAIIDLMVPDHNQQGGTLVIPGHGRLGDEADVVDYRDMVTIVRDRVQDMVAKKMTLEQIKAAKPSRGYDPLYAQPSSTGDQFVEAVYRSLTTATRSR